MNPWAGEARLWVDADGSCVDELGAGEAANHGFRDGAKLQRACRGKAG
jgi:hypothetical protein